jgi:uncharacterized membrane protein
MTGTLTALFLAVLAFVGGHFLLSWPPLRGKLTGQLGEPLFAGLYSLLMVLFLIWLIAAYRVAPPLVLWDLGSWTNVVPVVVMPVALVLAVLGVAGRSPTLIGGDAMFKKQTPEVRGAATITRHPFLAGVTLWALAHLVANGDAASVLLFGGMAVLAVGGMVAIDHKRAAKLGEAWVTYAANTSRVPFGAALAGRVKVDWAGIGWARPLAGVVLYVVLLAAHDWLFGVPVVV